MIVRWREEVERGSRERGELLGKGWGGFVGILFLLRFGLRMEGSGVGGRKNIDSIRCNYLSFGGLFW